MAEHGKEGESARGSPVRPQEPLLYPVEHQGQRYCALCHEQDTWTLNHPEHPNSPYCAQHYRERRTQAQRLWRQRQRQGRDAARRAAWEGLARGPDGTLTLNSVASQSLRECLDEACEDIKEAAETLGFLADDGPRSTMIKQTSEHMKSINAALRPWLDTLERLEKAAGA